MAADDSPTGSPVILASIATSQMCAIPSEMIGRFVRISLAKGGTYSLVRFGTSSSVSVAETVSTRNAGTGALTPGTTEPHVCVVQGATERVKLDSSWTHFAHIEAATGGLFSMVLATGDGD
jgi:hypothetical protein